MTRDVLEGEQWRPVPGFEGIYEASNLGRVYSVKRPGPGRTGRLLKPTPNGKGYLTVLLHRDGTRWSRRVHQVVLLAFVGPRPPGLEVRHLNGNKLDNRLENLRYGTHSENMRDLIRHGGWTQPVPRHPRIKPLSPNCRQGHPYDEANTYYISTLPGRRHCRACRAARHEARAASPRPIERRPERWQPIKHGTDSGYTAHLKRKVPIPADDSCGCRRAHADAVLRRRARSLERGAA